VLWLLSLYIQWVVAWWMLPMISEDEFKEKLNETMINGTMREHGLFHEWRVSKKVHGSAENLPSLRGKILNKNVLYEHHQKRVEHACKGAEWSWPESVIDDLRKYQKPMTLLHLIPISAGRFFGLISIFIWAGSVAAHFRKLASYSMILLVGEDNVLWLPWREYEEKWKKELNIGRHRNEIGELVEGEFHSPHERVQRALAHNAIVARCLVAIVALRVFTSGSLAYYGVVFLAHTDNLKDFILNSVALEFVFGLSSLVYSAFDSVDDSDELEGLNKHFEKKKNWVSGFLTHAVDITGVLACAAVLVVGIAVLFQFSDEIDERVYQQLCAKKPGIIQPSGYGVTLGEETTAAPWFK